MAQINFGSTVTLKQAAQLIVSVPKNRFMLEGEPGIGKSTLIQHIVRLMGEGAVGAYIDVPNLDIGDTAMPVVNHEKLITQYYPNGRFKLHESKRVVIMLDEFTKGMAPVKNMLHPLLEVNNPRLGDLSLPEGSIVFLTGNLGSDGVGDVLQAHSRNRLGVLRVRKANADEWLEWAVNNNIEPVVMAWVRQFPHCLASYLDGDQDSNPYIYNPRKMQAASAFITPRSLELMSNVIAARDVNDPEAVIAALTGYGGEAAARDMEAFITYQDQLPSWQNVIDSPKTATVPDAPGACAVMVFGAITKIDKHTITPFMTYLERFEAEWQAVFAINIAKNPNKQQIAFSSKAFCDWLERNQDIL